MTINEDPAQQVIRYVREAHTALSRAYMQLQTGPHRRSKPERELQRALYRAHVAAASASSAMAGRHLETYPDLHMMHASVAEDVTGLKMNKTPTGALIHPILAARVINILNTKLVTYMSMAAREPCYLPPTATA